MALTLKPRMVSIQMDHAFIPVVTVELIAIHDDPPTLRLFSAAEYEALMKFLCEIVIDIDDEKITQDA